MEKEMPEELSALVDGELEESEIRNCLDQMEEDSELASRWQRYHLIGDAMRSNMPPQLDVDLTAHVRAAIADEPTVLVPRAKSNRAAHRNGWRYVAGMAVAASVAAIAVITIQPSSGPEGIGAASLQTAQQSVPNSPPPAVMSVSSAPRASIASYLINHNEYAGRHGMLPYVRIVNERVE